MTARHMTGAAVVLAGFALVGTGLVATTYELTAERIAQVERENLLKTLNALIPADWYDNDLATDTLVVRDRELLGTDGPVTAYRARHGGAPVAVVLTPEAPDGYNGSIRLMVAIKVDGSLAGVRVLSHKETPGLGDRIEIEKSDWIRTFEGRSLRDPEARLWKVRKDGGVFDQFTGATITPRAVVKAVRKALEYYEAHRNELFAAQPQEETPDAG